MENNLDLLLQAKKGDDSAKEKLVEQNLGLVWSVARRFTGRGYDIEDLFQIGCIGLIKSIDKFDFDYDVKFSTYAVPLIQGEIRRFLRDYGAIKVSRSLKEMNSKVEQYRQRVIKEKGYEPEIEEIAAALSYDAGEIVKHFSLCQFYDFKFDSQNYEDAKKCLLELLINGRCPLNES